MRKKLTIIIPFLNEGDEIRKTVANLRVTAGEEIDIILINDASTDSYDYLSVAQAYGAHYIRHTQRKGVAASRDEAILRCRTRYFLLLDGHMRVLQTNWVNRLLGLLEQHTRAIFCCQTVPLDTAGNFITQRPCGYGAYIDFDDLSVKWNAIDTHPEDMLVSTPCVLGASYSTSVDYWRYLKGLRGLRSYGYDEQLISIKCWLEGGTCYLIKDIVFGHIFRTVEEVKYPMRKMDFLFNRFYVATLFFPAAYKEQLFSRLVHPEPKVIEIINKMIQAEEKQLNAQKKYYARIFKRDLSFLIEINNRLNALQRALCEKAQAGYAPFS